MKKLILTLFLVCLSVWVRAQNTECMLGIGGKDTETIIQVFQLNEEQVQKMEDLRAELSLQNKAYQEEIRILFDSHPQSTTEELEALATKYKALKDRVLENAREYDIRLLQLFNPRQYDRYLELCASAQRVPYQVVPRPFPKKDPE
ncbi:hypothetical protein SAMN06265375_102298 [Muriicola jejuensis]|uniref:Periplasmic heavy metal sensor n=1 Tax=Muriicola jejuensis TaxID=504488 RepID=A0A6P0UDM9_9FLAO|nr:hypothetical protein [Muriicola jejuensis]NER10722.1 hypothetical protein [Muriicola jejuensis]SMP16587.1 hypothetical protein SAMN06265375_102298 [Muriicola jejuensis]